MSDQVLKGEMRERRQVRVFVVAVVSVLVLMQVHAAPASTLTRPVLKVFDGFAPAFFFHQGWQLFAPAPPDGVRVVLARQSCTGPLQPGQPYENVSAEMLGEAKSQLLLQSRKARGIGFLTTVLRDKNAYYLATVEAARIEEWNADETVVNRAALQIGNGYAEAARIAMARLLFLHGQQRCAGQVPEMIEYTVVFIPSFATDGLDSGTTLYESGPLRSAAFGFPR